MKYDLTQYELAELVAWAIEHHMEGIFETQVSLDSIHEMVMGTLQLEDDSELTTALKHDIANKDELIARIVRLALQKITKNIKEIAEKYVDAVLDQ